MFTLLLFLAERAGSVCKRQLSSALKPGAIFALLFFFVTYGTAAGAAEGTAPGESGMDPGKGRARIALIVDDFGNGLRGTEAMLKLPVKFTVAVMPFLSTSKKDAETAYRLGHDVLLHLPMEPRSGKPEWLGPGAVLTSMTDAEIRSRVEAALEQVPHAVGINNHMGSKVTGDERVMAAILSVCRERGLIFVDSHTNYRSVAGKVAVSMGLPPVENQLFLDDVHSRQHVLKQLRLARKQAESRGYCIAIGHVGIQGPETAAGLYAGIDETANAVRFVKISELVKEEWGWNAVVTLP
ncbi:divergent polysaccharide deacetylase family protein [Paenibacillus sp. CN-4]|uniref:divergent polysaccharide deacetylase family protein n=1 Tax=Paenibacillus nanchangensis TaxID=3348343 RepID=UPI00397DADB3